MDIRLKTFVVEATKRMSFLNGSDWGFSEPEIIRADHFPTVIEVRYRRAGACTIRIRLILAYMGEEYVSTEVCGDPPDGAEQGEIGSHTAHTGYQMRRALDRQADTLLSRGPQCLAR
jgi:hypothetical protein